MMKSQRAALQSSLSVFHDIKIESTKVAAEADDSLLKASHLSSDATSMGDSYQEIEGMLEELIRESDADVKQIQSSQTDCSDSYVTYASLQIDEKAKIEDRDDRYQKNMRVSMSQRQHQRTV